MYEEMSNEDVSPLNFIKEEIVIEESEELGVVKQEIQQDLEMGYNGENCSEIFKTEGNLEEHNLKMHSTNDKLPSEFRSKHFNGDHSKTLFQCDVCLKTFISSYLLKRHSVKHSGERLHKCDQCRKVFKDQTTLKNHIVRMHGEGERFPCGICERTFIHKSRLDYHLTTHKDMGQHVSDVCDTAFKEKADLTRHKNYVHTKKSIQCVCPKKFETLKYLQKQKPFKCDLSSKVYKTPPALSEHKLQTHGKTGQFSCDTCGKKFTVVLTSLEQHLFMHSDETHFKCNQCDKTYKTKLNLAGHKSYTHVLERPFPCEWCLQSFETTTFLQQHPSQQEEKRFTSETEPKEHLEEHVSKYHGDNTKTNLDNHENGSFGFGVPSDYFHRLKTSLNKLLQGVHTVEVKVEPIVLYDPEAKQEVLDEIKEEMELDVKQEPRDFDQS